MTDPLIARIDSIKSRIKSNANTIKTKTRTATMWGRFWLQLITAFTWFYSNIFDPIFGFIYKPLRFIWQGYRELWVILTYKDGTFNKMRGGIMFTITAFILWWSPTILGFTWDVAWYILTVKEDEEVYLNNSQEVFNNHDLNPNNDTHAIKGCEHLPCSDDNSISFRVRPNAFNHIWSMAHHHSLTGWFYPDYVAAAVSPGLNRCIITSYGVRVKFLMRNWDVYPDILKIKCELINGGVYKGNELK